LRDYNKTHKYGKGVYFATEANYPIHTGYALFDANDNCAEILYCRVICGQSVEGKEDFVRPPSKDKTHEFESMVDNTKNPSIYVVTNDYQSYPVLKLIIRDKSVQTSYSLSNQTCPQNHPLVEIKTVDQYQRCDVCQRVMAKNMTMHECSVCQWKKCKLCFQKTSSVNMTDTNDNNTTSDINISLTARTCPENHQLQPLRGVFRCDDCGKTTSNVAGCRICNYDLCSVCLYKTTSYAPIIQSDNQSDNQSNTESDTQSTQISIVTCPNSHQLILSNIATFGYCDVCKRVDIPKQSTMYKCKPCNFEMCESCHEKKINSLNSGSSTTIFDSK